MVQRLRQGLVIDDEMLDTEELFGDPEDLEDGFIVTEHTLRHYKEFTRPPLFSRVGMSTWEEQGKQTFEDRVRQHYDELVQHPVRNNLSADCATALAEAFHRAVEEVCKH